MIKEAIKKGEAHQSKIPQSYFDRMQGGLSSEKIYHTLNNLAASSTAYLEVGTYMGSTLLAATYGNDHLYKVAIDNFCMKPKTRNHFFQNVKDLEFQFIEKDCFKVSLKEIKKPIDLYFFDGEHSYEAQYNAIEYFLPVMADEFIYVVDDWSNGPVKKGTFDAIRENGLTIMDFEIRGDGKLKDKDGWWCGFAMFKLKK
jgi:predicted O-methyltransferase YrrM